MRHPPCVLVAARVWALALSQLAAPRCASTRLSLVCVARDDAHSINNLQQHIASSEAARAREVRERDEEIEKLRDELWTLKKRLSEEERLRSEENVANAATIASLQNESARLRHELTDAHAAAKAEQQRLALLLADETADKEGRLAKHQEEAQHEATVRKQEREDLEGREALLKLQMQDAAQVAEQRYAELEAAKQKSEAMLRAQLATLAQSKAEGEERLTERLRRMEALKLQETTLLKNRVERLSKLQDAALNAGGSKARSLLYIESMKSKTRQESSMSFRGETDTTGLPAEAMEEPYDGAP